MQRALLSTAAAVILAAASITPASAQHQGGSSGGGGVSRGGSPGVAHSAPSAGGGGSAFRGGGGTQFQGGMQFRGGGNGGNVNASRGPVGGNQFRAVGGNQFRAVSPTSRSFAASRNFAQGHFAQTRPFRHGRSVVRFGAPFFYDDYGYYPYSSYSSDDECYETRRVWTNAGWRYAQVYVCEQ